MLVIAVAVCIVAACSSAAPPVSTRTGALVWHRCGTIQCATLAVPLDRAHPTGVQIQLHLARRPANHARLGVLLANPGGPGGSGIELVQQAHTFVNRSVLDRFDIVSWDPRGVGESSPVHCSADLDFFYAVDANGTDAATVRANAQASQRLVEGCRQASAKLLPYLATQDTVDDMDAIRAAMQVPKVDYLGFSYGTYIGALYAQKYPQRVRSMVLDGAIDPAVTYDASALAQSVGFERSFDAFLQWCRDDAACEFARGGDPRAAYDALMISLAGESDPALVHGQHRSLGAGEASIGVLSALYSGRDGWEGLGHALNDAARGDGSALLALSDAYTGRQADGSYDNQTAAFYATVCLDGPAPHSIAAVTTLAKQAARAAPHFGASTVWSGLPCTYWPVAAQGKPAPIHAPGAPPIVVVGNTDDPATPYSGAQGLAGELRSGHLLTYVGEGHTAYGRGDACIDNAVDDYLISLKVPARGQRCR
jgi:pimeloyl-ACP methyl ester carboxylesterase